MLTPRQRRIIQLRLLPMVCAGALGALFCFYGEEIWWSSSYCPPKQLTGTQSSQISDCHQGERALGHWITADAGGFFTFWLVIVGGIQAALFLWQLDLIRKSLSDAKDAAKAAGDSAKAAADAVTLSRQTAERELRAYIYLKNIGTKLERGPSTMGAYQEVQGVISGLILTPVWANSGNTPARRILSGANIKTFDAKIPDDFDFSDSNPPRRGVLAPNSEMFAQVGKIAQSALASVARKESNILIWGWLDYDDVFPGTERHRTEFCFRVDVRYGADGIPNITFPIYGRFNGFDGECLKKPAPYQET
jgi:hypothetical protein